MRTLSNKYKELIGWLKQCRIRTAMESEETTVPPSKEEIDQLILYLKEYGLNPLIIGSVGVLSHLKDMSFRPTHDIDIYVNNSKLPSLLPGWKRDEKSIGIVSWVSPTGGYVDFMHPGSRFPNGEKIPQVLKSEEAEDFPTADIDSLFRMKLNSSREKDFSDLVSLVRKINKVPTENELGFLNQSQKENLDLLNIWIKSKKVLDDES